MRKPTTNELRARLAENLSYAKPRAFAYIAQAYACAHNLRFPIAAVFWPEPEHFYGWTRKDVASALRILKRLG